MHCLICHFKNKSILCAACVALCSEPQDIFLHTERLLSAFCYEEPIITLIHEYKFSQKIFLSRPLGHLLGNYLKNKYQSFPEVIIPMPIHSKRLKERGYHQVYELAKPVAKLLKIPIARDLVLRTHYTVPQSSLPMQERFENVRDSFLARLHSYQHVAILDDVITTGATVHALCTALREKNPTLKIDIWSLACTKKN